VVVLLKEDIRAAGGSATAATARAQVVAIHKELLAQVVKSAGLDSPGALDGCVGRKSPARATSTLVFNRVNNTFGSPVDGLGIANDSDLGNRCIKGDVIVWFGFKESLVLLNGPVGELIVTKLKGGLFAVVLLNLTVSAHKLGKTVAVLFERAIVAAVLRNEGEERGLDFRERSCRGSKGCNNEGLHINY